MKTIDNRQEPIDNRQLAMGKPVIMRDSRISVGFVYCLLPIAYYQLPIEIPPADLHQVFEYSLFFLGLMAQQTGN